MIIFRSAKEIKKSHYERGGGFEIVLTPDELRRAYDIQKETYYAQDIAQSITDKIIDAGKGSHYSVDFPIKLGKALACDFESTMEGSLRFMNRKAELLDDFVNNALMEMGIDPETMERR